MIHTNDKLTECGEEMTFTEAVKNKSANYFDDYEDNFTGGGLRNDIN